MSDEIEPTSEEQVPDTSPGGELPPLNEVSAENIVSGDTDRPVADNKLPPPPLSGERAEFDGDELEAPNVNPPATKGKRGRKPLSEEVKKERADARAKAKSEGKPPPDFSKLSSPTSTPVSSGPPKPPRDYYMEACNLFFPVSFAAEKWLGPHWGIPIVDKEINGLKQKVLEPTEEQKSYLANMARWLEYEQFPEVNARWGFVISSIGYSAPKFKTSPTPERLKTAWDWFKVKILRKEPSNK